MDYELKDAAKYLKQRGVSFAVKEDHQNNSSYIFGVAITKNGKFFRANGKIISENMIATIIKTYPLK